MSDPLKRLDRLLDIAEAADAHLDAQAAFVVSGDVGPVNATRGVLLAALARLGEP